MELARWLADPGHPLTSRVMVNRIWRWHFGQGLVLTPDNFGALGDRPVHPKLLDWLARRFSDSGWSIKTLQKEILLSHAYMLSSADSAANEEIDPDNAYIWRHSRSRLDAEEIRDSLPFD